MASGWSHGWRFIDLAGLGRNSVRSYLATLLRLILLPLGYLILVAAAVFFADTPILLAGPRRSSATVMAVAVGFVIAMGLALVWGVVRSHRRPWMSLVSPDLRFDWRRLAIGAAVQSVLLVVTVGLGQLLAGKPWPSRPPLTPGLAAVLLLLPFQATSEEMLFRGYLTQALGRVLRRRAVIVVLVGLVFGAVHFNAYGPLTIPYLMLLSLVFSAASLRDERLELAIGAHTANNWLAIGLFDVLGEAGRGVRLEWTAFPVLLLSGALFYGVTRLLVRRFCEPGAAS